MRSELLFVLLCVVTACKKPVDAKPPPRGPTEVGVVTLHTETVTLKTELAGRTTASLASEVRPQVSGIIKARTFEEGSHVKAGQVLYRIDPAMYRAAYAQAKADLASAKATLESATSRAARYANLVAIEGVSKQEADDAKAAAAQARASVAQKEAALEAARINLAYTQIKAPISGRIGKSLVTTGALVTANQPQPLATIRSLDPIYVDLTESSEDRLRLRAQLGAGLLEAGSTKVKLELADNSIYTHEGTLEFAEVAVDQATGSVTLRAVFPNPEHALLPGMYVRAVVDQGVAQNAILAPQQGISHDAKGNATALVVGPDSKVQARTVVANRAIGDRWLVTSGLAAGDRLIVEGLNKVRPGAPVRPVDVPPSAAGELAAGSAAPAAPGAPPAGAKAPAPAPSSAAARSAAKPASSAPAAHATGAPGAGSPTAARARATGPKPAAGP